MATQEELEEEIKFLADYISNKDKGSSVDKWTNAVTDRLINWLYFGTEIREHQLPWATYELDAVERFWTHVPDHIKPKLLPKIEECREMVAVKTEKTEREKYLRTK